MSAYREVTGALKESSRWQRAAFATACAERMAPLVHLAGGARNVSLFESGLEAAWASVVGRKPGGAVSQLLTDVKRAAKVLGTDDGDSPEFYVLRALNVLEYALTAIRKGDVKPSEWACSELLGVKSGFDLILQTAPPHVLVIDPNDPPPPGPLQAQEIDAQKETLRLLQAKPEPDEELVSSLRRLSAEASREFERVLPEFGRRMNWRI